MLEPLIYYIQDDLQFVKIRQYCNRVFQVDAYRKMLIEKDAEKHGDEDVDTDEFGRAVYKDSHKRAQAQKEKNERLKAAFGIAPEFVEGSSFNENRQAIEEANRFVAD